MRNYSYFSAFRVYILLVLPTIAMAVLLLRLLEVRGLLFYFVLAMLFLGILLCIVLMRLYKRVFDEEVNLTQYADPVFIRKLEEFEMLRERSNKDIRSLRKKKDHHDKLYKSILQKRNELWGDVEILREKSLSFNANIDRLLDLTEENIAMIDENGVFTRVNSNYSSLIGEDPVGKSICRYLISQSYNDTLLISKIKSGAQSVQGIVLHVLRGRHLLSWMIKVPICEGQFLVICSPVNESLVGKSLSNFQNKEIDYINKINLSLTINKGTAEMLSNIARSVKELFRIGKIALARETGGKWAIMQSEGLCEFDTAAILNILGSYHDGSIEFIGGNDGDTILVAKLYSEMNERIVMMMATDEGINSDDLMIIKMFAHQASIVIQRSKSYEQLKKLFFNTVISLVDVIEAKDKYTEGHSKRVAYYSVELAKKLGYREEEIEKIEIAGVLHDVGKVSISQDILQKTGSLTKEEFAAIKTHPWNGYKIIEKINFDENIKFGVAYHHVRYDLTGYPEDHGLTELPEFAALIAIADAFDAMTSKRSYSMEKTVKQAIDELIKGKGTHFCPYMVDAMVELLTERNLIAEAYRISPSQDGTFRSMRTRVQEMDEEAWKKVGVYENRA